MSAPKTVYLKDYRPPAYWVDTVDLTFDLDEARTRVTSRLALRRNDAVAPAPLVLDGVDLELKRIALDGRELGEGDYRLTPTALTLDAVPQAFTLEIETEIRPQANTVLEGLYMSSGLFCTQCEAEGFRRITYFPDRPDVMARYMTTVIADREHYPVLLSNGNEVGAGETRDGRHWSRWQDPFPKPSYLFALVAGDLAYIEDHFTTRSGRRVRLRIYAAHTDIDKCGHAMASLKKAMAWDEEVFGLECDLDVYNIVAVADFNMGAMENKGLNIFNAALVLARPDTATDDDFARIESVIGHEYFHNWTGNRVTCRDWFQLSLKEGLTVFRDQQFSADVSASPVKRIDDVRALRARQFPEDAGPMAHPVRPESYIEINNFYTSTVYEKGAEVIRMMHTLLGPERFRKGIDLYFARHDGQAVTCDDFVAAMEDASGVDLSQFRLWYSQAGTPIVSVRGRYDERARSYTLEVAQSCPPTPGQPKKKPLHIPLRMALIGPDGQEMPLRLDSEKTDDVVTCRVLDVCKSRERFCFSDISAPPVPSLLRGFSAPVKLETDYSRAELAFLMAHDGDGFARWEAGQTLAAAVLLDLVTAFEAGSTPRVDETFMEAFAAVLAADDLDPAFRAEMLLLPSQNYLAQMVEEIDVEAIHGAHRHLRETIAARFGSDLAALYRALSSNEPFSLEARAIGRRRLRNTCLAYLMDGGGDEAVELAGAQFRGADNMTDRLAALGALAHTTRPEADEALAAFYDEWRGEALVLDKWFAVQARSERADTFARVQALFRHADFDVGNPNRVRALIATFAMSNQVRFHEPSGGAYAFYADRVLELDKRNPRLAARLMSAFEQWRRFEPRRRALMKAEIERILKEPGLSRDVFEIASKTLA